jgi:hypothetical protein
MISNREVALSIKKGKGYLIDLKSLTDLNTVSYDQITEVARRHYLHEDIAQGFLLSGVLVAYYITETSIEAEQTIQFDAGKDYLIYWTIPITDELAYHVIAASLYIKRLEAYERFCLIYPEQEYIHCFHCELLIPIKRTDGFCSENCKRKYTQHKEVKKVNQSLKENLLLKLKFIRDFFKSFNLL